MKRQVVLTVIVGIAAFVAGMGISAVHYKRAAAHNEVLSALDRVGVAGVTLSLVRQQRSDSVSALCNRIITRNVSVAHEGLSHGVALRGESIPNITEAFRRTTLDLRNSGASQETIAQAEAVLAQLPRYPGQPQ
jgi:hypothetical protein